MPEIWNPGDLSVCIVDGQWEDVSGKPAPGPGRGSLNIVEDVETTPYGEGLVFHQWPYDIFDSTQFKKVPPHEEDEEDRITIGLYKKKKAKEPVGGT